MTDAPPISPPAAPEDVLEAQEPPGGRVDTSERGLREHAARGVVINAAFQVGFAALSLLQRFAVAAFLTVSEFGVWGIVLTIVLTLSWLKQIGISDKYVQQDEADQELAFQKAFTLELLYTLGFCVLVVLALPLFGLIYDTSEIVLPAAVLTLSLIGGALQAPIWISFRSMRFVRQRVLEGLNPVVSTIVMIGLAIAGAGYWSIVIGIVAGSFAAAVGAIATSPYPLRLRYERGTLREYVGFSAPLLASGVAGIVIVQGTMVIGSFTVGLAGLGALALAASLLTFTDRVDQVISRTIYPAVCAVKDRRDLLYETFVKSNRLALIWGMPFGFGMLLFAPDLVEFVLGERWEPAVILLQTLGVMVGIRQVAFNWGVFFSAIGDTRPFAVNAGVLLAVFAAVTAPAMILWGLDGYIVGVAASLVAELAVRSRYLRRLFPGFGLLRHLVRSVAPVVPAVGIVLVLRLVESGPRTLLVAAAELVIFLLVAGVATFLLERRLLGEMVGYLRGRGRDSSDEGIGGRGGVYAR